MPSKKKKYNARFPAGRIKKIMQSDEEIGKVAQAVPVIISRTLELFVESLLTKTVKITNSRNAKTLSTSHMKQCIMSEQRFDFLRELVKNIPDISVAEEAANYNDEDAQSSPEEVYPDSDTPYDLSMPSTSMRATRGTIVSAQSVASYNGSGTNTARQHLRRGVSSVIMHTTSVINNNSHTGNHDSQPARYARSDSSPANVAHTVRQRLKHQSQSLPAHHNSNITDCSPPKRSRVESTASHAHMPTQPKQPHTAIPAPAPIVSFDFCNKPIVKIDYSNLPMPATAPTAPHSAPANIARSHSAQSEFNFSTEPVISIDLSNIVADAAAAVAAASGAPSPAANGSTKCISIGGLPSSTITAGAATPFVSATAASCSYTPNSKATMAAPFNPNPSINIAPAAAVKTPGPAKTTAANKNFLFELDEDYDNI